jgi:hypothetical protein
VAVTAVVVALALLGAVVALVLRAPATGSAPAPTVAAAPPPPSAPVETAAPAPAAPAASVRITVEIEPATAAIELDGAPVEGRSVVVPRGDATHKLVARAPGYAPETREVSARENAAIAIVLHRADAGAPRGPIRKRKVSLETDL